jgi:DNA adenine methylase
MKLRPIFKNHGGKGLLAAWIIDHFPANYPDLKYVETCGGEASVLLNKTSATNEIYNELNPKIANVFHCIKNYPIDFYNNIEKIEYSEKSFKEASKIEFSYGSMDAAIAEVIRRRMSRGGLGKHFSWSHRLRGGRPGEVNAWESFKSLIPQMAERLKNVEITNKDHLEIIKEHDSPNTLFYCDPPYVHSTRTATDAYDDYEMTDEQHSQLGELINKIQGKAVISGYDSKLYQDLFKGWQCICKSVKNNAGQGKTKSNRIEVLWLNY